MQEVLSKIKPSEKEEDRIAKVVSKFLKKLEDKLVGAKPFIGGSFGKGTWLSGDHDVDIFVLFEDDTHCSDELEFAMKRAFSGVERVRGSRDYFQVDYKDLQFEVVPVCKIERAVDARNVTDVSPLHVKWVREKTDSKLREDIRLAKQFCKAQKVYGAETYVKGFSGYVVEILVIYYKGFEKFLKAATKWKKSEVINPEKREYDINKDKESALIVVDPVQPNRNAAAALSGEKFEKFVKSCKNYLKMKTDTFFDIKKVKFSDVKNYDIVLTGKAMKGKRDVAGTKLLKVYEFFLEELEKEGFGVLKSGWEWDKEGLFWYDVESEELSPYKERVGPPLDRPENVESFKVKHASRKILEKDGRIYAILPRQFRKLDDFIKFLIKASNNSGNVKNLKRVN